MRGENVGTHALRQSNHVCRDPLGVFPMDHVPRVGVDHQLRSRDRRGKRLLVTAGHDRVTVSPEDQRRCRDRRGAGGGVCLEKALERCLPDAGGRLAVSMVIISRNAGGIAPDAVACTKSRTKTGSTGSLSADTASKNSSAAGLSRRLQGAPVNTMPNVRCGWGDGETLHREACARARNQHRPFQCDSVHERRQVRREIPDPVAAGGSVGIP